MLFNCSPLIQRRGLCSESGVAFLDVFGDWRGQYIYSNVCTKINVQNISALVCFVTCKHTKKKKNVLPSSSTIVPLNCEDYNSEKLMAVYSALWSVYILVITLSNI